MPHYFSLMFIVASFFFMCFSYVFDVFNDFSLFFQCVFMCFIIIHGFSLFVSLFVIVFPMFLDV